MKSYGMNWIVTARDVDGMSQRKYTTPAGARKRFEEMLGYTIETAIWHMMDEMDDYPEWTSLPYIKGVSNYGCVVSIEWETTDHANLPEVNEQLQNEERKNRELSCDHYRGF
jgi:hypothetical protein